MFVSECLGVNECGHLTIGGVDTVELAGTYGTPLYVLDENHIRATIRAYRRSIDRHYAGKGHVAYASKAFCCREMCRIAAQEGIWLDLVSAGEMHTAITAGFPMGNVLFHGNNKPAGELAMALDAGVGRIVVDNIAELELINNLAITKHMKANIHMRIKPGVEAHTHEFIQTGQNDSKFGFDLQTGEAPEAIRRAVSLPNITLKGLGCHIGSQVYDVDAFQLAARIMLELTAQVRTDYGIEMTELDLGGGYGIKYQAGDDPAPYESYMEKISATIRDTCKELGLKIPEIFIEPGRSVVGPAGITLYKVGSVKEIPGVRTYVSIDGGMADNPRYILYQAEYTMLLAARAAAAAEGRYTVAGRCCENGDLLGENVPLPHPREGEVLAVLTTGAYNYSMASHYNRLPTPPVVMIRDGVPRIVIRRESYEDCCRNDI